MTPCEKLVQDPFSYPVKYIGTYTQKNILQALLHEGLYKMSNKDNPFVKNQVTTQNFMHLPYLDVELCLLSLSFLSIFFDK